MGVGFVLYVKAEAIPVYKLLNGEKNPLVSVATRLSYVTWNDRVECLGLNIPSFRPGFVTR